MTALGAVARGIDQLSEWAGWLFSWLAPIMVLLQFAIVLMRYVYGVNDIALQEAVIYLHASLFLLVAGYTLKHNGHVRVDVLYRTARPRHKSLVNLFGTLFFLLPFCALIVWTSWDYVADSWAIQEGSKETSGIQAVFLLKTLIPVFAVLVALQGLSLIIHSARVLAGLETLHEDEAEAL